MQNHFSSAMTISKCITVLLSKKVYKYMGVSKIGVHQNGWFIMVPNPMYKWMIWGVFPYFWVDTHINDHSDLLRHFGFHPLSPLKNLWFPLVAVELVAVEA